MSEMAMLKSVLRVWLADLGEKLYKSNNRAEKINGKFCGILKGGLLH